MHRYFVLLFTLSVLWAQDPRGTILGRVVDPSGAVIAGALVRVTNVETNISAEARSNDAGNFTAPYLLTGTYTVRCEVAGFKQYVREGVQVRISDVVRVDIPMEVGNTTEAVEVRAETPLLSTAEATMGHVVDQRRIQELPTFGGNPLVLVSLAPGTVNATDLRIRKTAHTQGGSQFSTDGAGTYNNEFTIDGVSDTQAAGSSYQVAFIPPTTAISEFKVQTAAFDASVGHTGGGTVNMSIRSGTNQLHGEVHEWLRNRVFDAPNIFQNRAGTKIPVYQDNRFGASGGGPVVLPRLYNGRNKTFFFYAWEMNVFGVPQTFVGAVPNEAVRRGDLSYLLKLGPNYQLYDPLSTTSQGSRLARQPIPGNIIPESRIDPVARKIMNYWPMPNQTGTADGRNNWVNADTSKQRSWTHIGRVDHAFSESHRMYVRVHKDFWRSQANRTFSDEFSGILVHRKNRGLALDDVYVFSPSFLMNLRYGITQQEYTEDRLTKGFDLASLGFSSRLLGLTEKNLATFPYVNVSPFSVLGAYSEGDGYQTSQTHSLAANFTRFQGGHSFRFGADFRVYRKNKNRYPLDVSPQLSYNSTFTRGPLDNSTAPTLGGEIASFLLGVPAGSMTRSGSYAEQDQYLGLYFQDDYKITPRLTVNLGLRWEYETPITERFDRSVAGFAFSQSSPIEAAARANYAKAAVPELPADQFRVLGGLTFVGADGNPRNYWKGEKNNLAPRIGLAYQLTNKTIARLGYGIFYETIGTNRTQSIQTGFSQSTPIQASLDGGLTYIASNADPFPSGLSAPLGPKGGLSTYLGQAISFFSAERRNPYNQRWSLDLQRELPGGFLSEIGYVGSRGTRLGVSRNINALPAQYLSRSLVRDTERINYLSAIVPNPFYGLNPIYGTNSSRNGLLTPYPQFGAINVEQPMGYSWFHSMQARLEKRFSHGYSVQLGYMWSKTMQATEMLNASDPVPYRSISDLDRRHRVTASYIWELPFGRGRRFGRSMGKAVDAVAGGWQLTGMVQRQSGPPLAFGDVWTLFTGNPNDVKLPKDQRSVDRWFNINAGFNRNSAQQLGSNIRYSALRFSNIRGDGQARWDFSIFKDFRFTEQVKMQLRAECDNAWNHPNLFTPVTTPTATNFGMITSQDVPRVWMLNLALSF